MVKKNDIKPKKRFGQHFLNDQSCLKQIIEALNIQAKETIVEIGPGLGALTDYLLPLVSHLTAIELDRDLIPVLRAKQAASKEKLKVLHADALTFDFQQLVRSDKEKLRLVGNLAYNIATPLLFYLIHSVDFIQDLHFMVQKEVADRLTAQVGESSYSRLTVMMQYYFKMETLFIVPPQSFSPPPKVYSAVVRLIPHASRIEIKNVPLFEIMIKYAFNQRRKTISNSLSKLNITRDQLTAWGMDVKARPQELSLEDYARLTHCFEQSQSE